MKMTLNPVAFAVSCLLAFVCNDSRADANVNVTKVLPGCYQSTGLRRSARPVHDFVIAIDQTTVLTTELTDRLVSMVDEIVVPGHRISVATFSAYSPKHYLRQLITLDVESAPSPQELRKLPIAKRRLLEPCLELQPDQHRQLLRGVIRDAVRAASRSIGRSEIINAFQQLGPALAAFEGSKTLLVVSDGLEHAPGATTSFYADGQLRLIDSKQEINALGRKHLARLSGVQVHFFGGGLSSLDTLYRDQEAVEAVAQFWSLYAQASGGTLVEFGRPELRLPLIQ